jgi:LmbE family N-acetylglucosaminyl deacetylase
VPIRILSIHAHPDDTETLAGGTLALLAKAGHEITIVTMTPGDCGSAEYTAEEISEIRRKEATAAASFIGARYLCAEFPDLAIFNDDASRRRVTEILRQTQPQIVITSAPVDYHCDHEATSALVRDACFAAPAPNYSTQSITCARPLEGIPHLYFMDPVGSVNRDGVQQPPDFFVDVESTFPTKRVMLAQHASQHNWLSRQHGMDDYLETMERWTRAIGRRAGREMAEGFRHYTGHPYPQTPLLEELLDGHVVITHAGDIPSLP